jgi:hypothetical protein
VGTNADMAIIVFLLAAPSWTRKCRS